jgi:hypothetical protein
MFRDNSRSSNAVVTPIVPQTLTQEMFVINKGVDGKKLDCGNAEGLEVTNHVRIGETGERAAELL